MLGILVIGSGLRFSQHRADRRLESCCGGDSRSADTRRRVSAVFLLTLLFQATLGMNLLRNARRLGADIGAGSSGGCGGNVLTVGYALVWASALPLTARLLVGAIVSTTDPRRW